MTFKVNSSAPVIEHKVTIEISQGCLGTLACDMEYMRNMAIKHGYGMSSFFVSLCKHLNDLYEMNGRDR